MFGITLGKSQGNQSNESSQGGDQDDASLAAKKAAEEAAAKSKQVTIKFTVPRFRHNGVEYSSKDIEEAASNGDADAEQIILDLVNLKSGIIEIINQ